MNGLCFEDFRAGDAGALEAMVLALYREDPGGEPMTVNNVRNTLAAFAQRPERGRLVIFRAEADTIGYAILVPYWSNEFGGELLFVDEIYVVPHRRGRGVVRAFMEQLSRAGRNRYRAIALELNPDNRGAEACYRKLGFQETGNRHLLRRITA